MIPLSFGTERKRLRLLCIGAHSDDIELGCGATLLRCMEEYERIEITWCVLGAVGQRAVEAEQSANALLEGAAELRIVLGDFQDAYFPADFRRIKDFIANVRRDSEVDLVLTHQLEDRHQDHRLVAELTWQAWRDHLILEYEIPKYEGGLGQPNLYVPVDEEIVGRKVRHLLEHFGSQLSKPWFTAETFLAHLRLRGVEAGPSVAWAEAFHLRKCVL
jgi:LmbE family N-acetylglucosaminyl deacetylase